MINWKVLSNELKICYIIYEFTEMKKEKIWFSKLVDILKGEISRSTISKNLDKLFDLGIIDGKWEKVDNKWTRTFKISGEAKNFINHIYKSTNKSI